MLCYVLRHHPEFINIKLDRDGFVDISELADGLSVKFPQSTISEDDIIKIAREDSDGRFLLNFDNTMIKAKYGHSVQIETKLEAYALAPETLYHGTTDVYTDSICRSGLIKGSRNHVHLCKSIDTAWKKARRHRHGRPVVVEIDAAGMQSTNGSTFYKATDDIVLVDHVPVAYLKMLHVGSPFLDVVNK